RVHRAALPSGHAHAKAESLFAVRPHMDSAGPLRLFRGTDVDKPVALSVGPHADGGGVVAPGMSMHVSGVKGNTSRTVYAHAETEGLLSAGIHVDVAAERHLAVFSCASVLVLIIAIFNQSCVDEPVALAAPYHPGGHGPAIVLFVAGLIIVADRVNDDITRVDRKVSG